MNWWHFSDENRLKWLRKLRDALKETDDKVLAEIKKLETSRSRFPGERQEGGGRRIGLPR
jgi:hypothetical protein